jgi:hypothetical protein
MRKYAVLGLLLGGGFGLWNLIETQLHPLSDDSPTALLAFYGPMFAIWSLAGFAAWRGTRRIWDGVKAAALVALVTFVVFDLAVIVRVNVFLEVLGQRSDWRNLMEKYSASGFHSLRAYANYAYLTGAPFKIFVATMIGAGMGLIGALVGSFFSRALKPVAQ